MNITQSLGQCGHAHVRKIDITVVVSRADQACISVRHMHASDSLEAYRKRSIHSNIDQFVKEIPSGGMQSRANPTNRVGLHV